MNSFKVYLPSNASKDRFPKNSSSDFHTELRHPIHLDGKWEVGLESICYSSKLGRMKEEGSLEINVRTQKKGFAYEELPFHFKLTKNNTWPGYEGVQVKPPKEVTFSNVLTALNTGNDLIIDGGQKLFEFSMQDTKLRFDIFLPNVYLRFSHKMNALFGNRKEQYSSSIEWESKRVKLKVLKTLTPSDYSIQYFCPDILEQESIQHLDIDDKQVPDLSKILYSFWKKKVLPVCGIKMQISKSNKVILHHDGRRKGLFFSQDFQDLISHKGHLYFQDSRWGWGKLKDRRVKPMGYYSVTIYSDKMKLAVKDYYHDIHLSMRPDMFDKTDYIISHLNHIVNDAIKKKTDDNYHERNHHFLFSQFNNRVKLTTGRWLHTTLDNNLCYILGFKENSFKEGVHEGTNMPSTLQEREQLFYVKADFVQSVPFGIQQLPILREFIHDVTDDSNITEKRFQPVSYIPVSKSHIGEMHISIVDQLAKPIIMKNVKTVLILHFQRVQ